jgi:hypothetical protein
MLSIVHIRGSAATERQGGRFPVVNIDRLCSTNVEQAGVLRPAPQRSEADAGACEVVLQQDQSPAASRHLNDLLVILYKCTLCDLLLCHLTWALRRACAPLEVARTLATSGDTSNVRQVRPESASACDAHNELMATT